MIPNIIRQASVFILTRPIEPYKRFLLSQIDPKERLIGLKGARGTGKTTLLSSMHTNRNIYRKRSYTFPVTTRLWPGTIFMI